VIAESRDACFNLTEGLPYAALAQGVLFTPSTRGSQPSTVSISLPISSPANRSASSAAS
jgi:hypothetical protein